MTSRNLIPTLLMRNKALQTFFAILSFVLALPHFSNAERSLNVAVIAPSSSCSIEARKIMQQEGWNASNYRYADAILVVVRSMLFNPLNFSYDSIHELEDDADNQLNISGENYHIYLYSINDNLSVNETKHMSYEADGY